MTEKENVQDLVDSYWTWLRNKTQLREINDWVEVTTPYLDRHNDFIQIYIQKTAGGYRLTDDGYTLTELEQAGCPVSTPKRKAILDSTLLGFGLSEKEGAIITQARDTDFALRKHMMVQGILAVSDMFYLARPSVVTIFLEDVTHWLDETGARFTPKVKLTGRSGYDHVFDFVIPRSREYPERLMRVFNTPNKTAAEAMILSWVDTRKARPDESTAYAILNDSHRAPPPSVIEALDSYEIVPLPWSERRDFVDQVVS